MPVLNNVFCSFCFTTRILNWKKVISYRNVSMISAAISSFTVDLHLGIFDCIFDSSFWWLTLRSENHKHQMNIMDHQSLIHKKSQNNAQHFIKYFHPFFFKWRKKGRIFLKKYEKVSFYYWTSDIGGLLILAIW